MRYSPAEKLEINRIVEDSELSTRQTLKELGILVVLSITGTTGIWKMAWRAWDLKSPRPLSIDCLHSLPISPAQTGSQARYYNTLYLHPTYEAAKKKLNLIKRELVILN